MKTIPKSQLHKYQLFYGHKSGTLLFKLKRLKVGGALQIYKSEWKAKSPISQILYNINLKQDRKFVKRTLLDRAGWLIKRVK